MRRRYDKVTHRLLKPISEAYADFLESGQTTMLGSHPATSIKFGVMQRRFASKERPAITVAGLPQDDAGHGGA